MMGFCATHGRMGASPIGALVFPAPLTSSKMSALESLQLTVFFGSVAPLLLGTSRSDNQVFLTPGLRFTLDSWWDSLELAWV